MQKLVEVENARAIMNQAMDWSVMKWLKEKKTVRKMADLANAALDRTVQETKMRWPESLKAAYRELNPDFDKSACRQQSKGGANEIARTVAKRVKEADDEAYRARMDAEDTFDLAEKRLSTSMARDGCQKAIKSWDLYEKAIRKAEEAMHSRAAS